MARKKLDPIKRPEDLTRLVLGQTLVAFIPRILMYPIGKRLHQIIELVMNTTIKLERESEPDAGTARD